jgi:hypothetical protein
MVGDTYPFLSHDYIPNTDQLVFTFLSQGDQLIPKIIAFTPVVKGGIKYYNWGFGDLVIDDKTSEFKIDDKVESNNGDVRLVFYTVVSTLSEFFAIKPEATVYLAGSNRQRLEVYKGLIYRHWRQIEPFYSVMGFINGQSEVFQPGLDFEFLLISRKKT